jgi:hypothetical protein
VRRSPKSVAFPVVAIVMYWITLEYVTDVVPPAKIPLVEEEHAANIVVVLNKSPKSVAFPVEAIVM